MRKDWVEYFLDIAKTVSTRATCDRLKVGSVIVKDNKIISTGYNGSPNGSEHCNDRGCLMENGSCVRTIHAEINAIMNSPISVDGATIYVTHFPCFNCSKHIVQAGIKEIYYKDDYRNSVKAINLLEQSGVKVQKQVY